MNKKIIALAAVLILAVPPAVWYYDTFILPEFGWEYEDCYLDVIDAEQVFLGTKTGARDARSNRRTHMGRR